MTAQVHADQFQQLLLASEATFCRFGVSTSGEPNTKGASFAGASVADPQLTIDDAIAENMSTRNRAYRHSPVHLTSSGTVQQEIYVRGNGAEGAMSDPTYKLIGQFATLKTDLLRQDDASAVPTTTTLEVPDAYEAGWRVGMGFYLRIPGWRPFVGFIKALTDVGGGAADTVTFAPPMTSAERTAFAAYITAGNTLYMRGGRTLSLAEGYGAEQSLTAMLVKRAYATQVFGCRGQTLECRFETGKEAKLIGTLMGVHSYQGGLAPATTIVEWTNNTTFEVAEDAGANLVVGMFARVVVGADTYYVRITSVVGDIVTIEDAGLPSDIDEEDPVPALLALNPDSTPEPAGAWLKYLNGRAVIGGESYDVGNMIWTINMNPQIPATPNNATGAMDLISTDPRVMLSFEQSVFNNTALNDFRSGSQVSALTMLSDGTQGNLVAVWAPAMHKSKTPRAANKDGLISMPIEMETGLYTGDTGNYDFGATHTDTTWRYFIAW